MADLVGKQIGSYRIISQIAWGAIANSYLAEQISTKDRVVVKILPSRMSGIDQENFLADAHLIAQLVHPHILRTLDFGVEDSSQFIVTAYAPNGSLRQRHPRGAKVPLATVVSYVGQVADALQYAHDRHVIHRDVKPENMLLGRNDEILLSDFDTAVVAEDSNLLSLRVAGTSPYIAPEQIQGKPRPASDQYSLGMSAYEWLSGTLPFRGSHFGIILQALNTPPLPLRENVPTIPPEIEQVIMRSLAKDPQQRFPKVREFASSLENAYLSSLQNSFFIIHTSNSDDLRVYQLEKREVAIGRASSNDILLSEDKLVSRYHATVRYENDNYVLYDEGSANGTFVNGQRLARGESRILRDDDHVSIGKHELVFRTPALAEKKVLPNIGSVTGSYPTIASEFYDDPATSMETGALKMSPIGSSPPHPISESVSSLVPPHWTNRDIKAPVPGEDASSQDSTKVLSLFAIARSELEGDNRAIVGKVYSIEAGISQSKPEGFEGEPFKLPLPRSIRYLFVDILLHTSDNIELISHWQRRLRYDSSNAEPQFVGFKFRAVTPRRSSIAIDFYYERRWLRTVHLEFDAVEQPQLIVI
jgi:serine/threonine protein kinase